MARERRLAFGDVAELYDLARPSYPSALVDDVLGFSGALGADRALEVGAGTGKATALFASRGLRVLALEPDPAMAEVARRNLADWDNVTLQQTEFERWSPDDASFRLIFSAQAWHWISPQVRYVHARQLLVKGGTLAVFWNRPRWDSCDWRDELADAYRRTAPDLGAGTVGPGPMHPAVGRPPEWWSDWARQLEATPVFGTPDARTYRWTQRYPVDEYLRLLQTHSDHILLEDEARDALLAAVGEVLDAHGGALELEYETALWMARAAGGSG